MTLKYFILALKIENLYWHLLVVAPVTIKEAVQAIGEYLAVKEA